MYVCVFTLCRLPKLVSRSAVNATTLHFAYGYKVHDMDDPLVRLTELVNEQFARASIPGAFLVDIWPFCTSQTLALAERLFNLSFWSLVRHVPDWIPGAGWKRLGREWGANGQNLVNTPFELVRDRRVCSCYPGLHGVESVCELSFPGGGCLSIFVYG